MNDAIKQAIDALEAACGNRCNAEYNPCQAREAIKALRAQPASLPRLSEAQIDRILGCLDPDDGGHDEIEKFLGDYLRAQPDLESRDFYELMQGYRHSGWDAAPSFEAVKAWLRNPTYEWGEQ